ncbi:MAG: MgtC/SapB family protein [Acidimicrobiia bacterium]
MIEYELHGTAWRLVAAVLLGALIGIEREATDQPAGLRTHISVCLGAALFGVVSTVGFDEFVARRDLTNIQVDVTRVASQVVVGIGFLGAGVIFRQGGNVHNLTTAASLWVVAAIGLAVGVGNVGIAAVAAALLFASLVALRPVRAVIRKRARGRTQLRVELGGTDRLGALLEVVAADDALDLRSVSVNDTGVEVRVVVRGTDKELGKAAERIAALAGVESVEVP